MKLEIMKDIHQYNNGTNNKIRIINTGYSGGAKYKTRSKKIMVFAKIK